MIEKYVYLIIVLYASCSGSPIDKTNDYYISIDSLKKILEEDSYYIAYQSIAEDTSSQDYNDIEIPEHLKNQIKRFLNNIYNKIDDDKTIDSIYNIYRIYKLNLEDINNITLFLDTNFIWVKNIINKELHTGNSIIDSLLIKFNGKIEPIGNYSSIGYQVYFYFNPANVDALITTLENVKGVNHAYKPGLIGGKSKEIKYKHLKNGKHRITYILAWGDCPSGCIYNHKWEFILNNNGEIISIKSFGDRIPKDYMN